MRVVTNHSPVDHPKERWKILHTCCLIQHSGLKDRHLPAYRVNGYSKRFPVNVCDEPGAVGTTQLSHVDGVAKLAPVCRIVAEPVHSGVIRPVQVPRHPIGRDIPGPPEV